MLIDWASINPVALHPGVIHRQVELDGLFAALQEFSQPTDPDRPWEIHSHPHQQAGHVLEGRIELRIGSNTHVLASGEAYFVPPAAPHGLRALQPTRLLAFYVHPGPDHIEEYRARNSPKSKGAE